MTSAWDDDWETIANKQEAAEAEEPSQPVKLSKAERRAKHAEEQKKLWESAETQLDQPIFLAARSNAPPVNSDFKPAMKVLARKPPPKYAGQDDNESDEEEKARAEREFADRQARAAKEREEKQKKYAEVRERLFGSPKSEEPSNAERLGNSSRNSSRGKGRGAGRGQQGEKSHSQSPARANAQGKKLFDPNYTLKPNNVFIQKRENQEARSEPQSEIVRQPKGPDGGKGFANRAKPDTPTTET